MKKSPAFTALFLGLLTGLFAAIFSGCASQNPSAELVKKYEASLNQYLTSQLRALLGGGLELRLAPFACGSEEELIVCESAGGQVLAGEGVGVELGKLRLRTNSYYAQSERGVIPLRHFYEELLSRGGGRTELAISSLAPSPALKNTLARALPAELVPALSELILSKIELLTLLSRQDSKLSYELNLRGLAGEDEFELDLVPLGLGGGLLDLAAEAGLGFDTRTLSLTGDGFDDGLGGGLGERALGLINTQGLRARLRLKSQTLDPALAWLAQGLRNTGALRLAGVIDGLVHKREAGLDLDLAPTPLAELADFRGTLRGLRSFKINTEELSGELGRLAGE